MNDQVLIEVKKRHEDEKDQILKELSEAYRCVQISELSHEETKQSFQTARAAWDGRSAEMSEMLEAVTMELEEVKRQLKDLKNGNPGYKFCAIRFEADQSRGQHEQPAPWQ